MFVVGTRTVSDEISMVELSKCLESEDRETPVINKTEKIREKEDKDEGKSYDLLFSSHHRSIWLLLARSKIS